MGEKYNALPEEMRVRLRARGNSWDEFIDVLANVHLDELERKAKENAIPNAPLQPPVALLKEPPKQRKRKRGAPIK